MVAHQGIRRYVRWGAALKPPGLQGSGSRLRPARPAGGGRAAAVSGAPPESHACNHRLVLVFALSSKCAKGLQTALLVSGGARVAPANNALQLRPWRLHNKRRPNRNGGYGRSCRFPADSAQNPFAGHSSGRSGRRGTMPCAAGHAWFPLQGSGLAADACHDRRRRRPPLPPTATWCQHCRAPLFVPQEACSSRRHSWPGCYPGPAPTGRGEDAAAGCVLWACCGHCCPPPHLKLQLCL